MRAPTLLLLSVFGLARPDCAFALEAEGAPQETGSWTQAFTEFGSGTFDHIQMRTLSGDGFVTGLDGIGAFSDGTWCQSYNDGILLTADGPISSFLGFSLHFEGALADPLSFDYQIWDGPVLQASLLVTWSGSGFTVGPSAWNPGRIDTGQGIFTGAFDVSQVGLVPGCMAEALYTVNLGQVCGGGPAAAPEYFHYTVFVDYPPSLQPTAVEQVFYPGGAHTFQHGPLSGGQLEISLSLFSAVTQYTGPLFRVHFDAVADLPPNQVAIGDVVLRKPVNTDLLAYFGPGDDLLVDAVLPTISLDTVPSGTCMTAAGFTVDVSATDPAGLGAIEWRLDSDPWQDTLLPASGTSYGPVPFFVDLTGVADGNHTVAFRSVDASCNASPWVDWAFIVDNTPPQQVNSLVAQPRDHAVLLSWAPTAGHDGYSIFRSKRPVYPYPFAPGLTPQLDPADSLTSVGPGVTSFLDDFGSDDFATRGVYDYRVVAFDCANGPAGGSIASATNYFLGDWAQPYSGTVCGSDLGLLSLYYNSTVVPASAELDVAPTSDFTAFGLPMPDGLIGFEDLVVFAINYRVGCSSPLSAQPRGKDALVQNEPGLRLEPAGRHLRILLEGDLLAASLRLEGEARITAAHWSGQGGQGPLFLRRESGQWVLDLALLETPAAVPAVIELELDRESDLDLVSADLRTPGNRSVIQDGGGRSADLPLAFGLLPSRPNPFNPSTRVRFMLDRDGDVRLSVYNLGGARVCTLVDGTLPAGEHERTFDGTGLASGPYWIRLEADGRLHTGRMLLVR